MPKHVEYHVVTCMPPVVGSRSVLCSVLTHGADGELLTKRSAVALVESMLFVTPDVTVAIQRRSRQPGAQWHTILAYRVDERGRMGRAPFDDNWRPRFS